MDGKPGSPAHGPGKLQGMVEGTFMNDRDIILKSVRDALRVPAPRPGQHGSHEAGNHNHPGAAPAGNPRPWLPPGGNSFEEQLSRFQLASEDLKTDFHSLASFDQALEVLRAIAMKENWSRIGIHRTDHLLAAANALTLSTLVTDDGYSVTDLEICDAGLSECDALVAQTGSVLVSSRSHGGRALTVLPPHHVVLARHSQLVGDLTDAFALIRQRYSPDYPSMISLITGPSRTGDIERILVLGAHGPRKLTVLFYP
jgi:L-lactate dehydrogenase complex protein LldG